MKQLFTCFIKLFRLNFKIYSVGFDPFQIKLVDLIQKVYKIHGSDMHFSSRYNDSTFFISVCRNFKISFKK